MSEKKTKTRIKGEPNFCGQTCQFCKKRYCDSCYEGKTDTCWKCGPRHYCDTCYDGTTKGTDIGDDSAAIISFCTKCCCVCNDGYKNECRQCQGPWEHQNDFGEEGFDCDCECTLIQSCFEHRPQKKDSSSDDSSKKEEEKDPKARGKKRPRNTKKEDSVPKISAKKRKADGYLADAIGILGNTATLVERIGHELEDIAKARKLLDKAEALFKSDSASD